MKAIDEMTGYGIGPMWLDEEAGRVTLGPGIYTLRKPIVFTMNEDTTFDGLHVQGLSDLDANHNVLDDDSGEGGYKMRVFNDYVGKARLWRQVRRGNQPAVG